MAKLVALLATLLVVAHVTAAYHTTITTVETIDSDNPSRQGMSQKCQSELQGRDMNACMEYMREKQGGGRYGMGSRGGSDQYDMCCRQLKSIHNEQCMCEGLEMEMERMGSHQMMSMAEDLPRMCGAMSSSCHFRSRMY